MGPEVSGTPTRSESDKRRRFNAHLVEVYDIGDQLGQGAFSTVWRCVHRATGQVRAVKKIDTGELAPREIAHEIALMKLLRHRNVVRCYDVFLEGPHVNIVVDMFTGGDLIDGMNTHRKTRGLIHDAQLAHLTRQMVAALAHVHGLQIIHRDIKGENFLSDRPDIGDPECVVALADFGTAMRLEPGETLNMKVGTPAFWAPEVYKGCYNFLADVWALGITTFILLHGNLPFEGEHVVCRPIEPGTLCFTPPYHASKLCVEFLQQLLEKDTQRRPTAAQAAKIPWMFTPAQNRAQAASASNEVNSLSFKMRASFHRMGGCVLSAMRCCLSGVMLCVEICMDSADASKRHSNNSAPHDEHGAELQGPEEATPAAQEVQTHTF